MSTATQPGLQTSPEPAPPQSGLALRPLRTVSHEVWILLAIFAIAVLVNSVVAFHRMVLGLYALPTLYSAYVYGRRHAVLTAFASVFLVVALAFLHPNLLGGAYLQLRGDERWLDFTVWGGILVITAYAMGSLYELKEFRMKELRESYNGILVILQHIASDNKYSQNHPFRVSLFATRIAEQMRLDGQRIEDIRAAALLHEVEKVGISKEILYKAAQFSEDEVNLLEKGSAVGQSGNSLRRVLPILLAYQAGFERADASVPLEARILSVADAYDSLTSARTGSVSPGEAMVTISQRAGVEYDEAVVDALNAVFHHCGTAQPVL